mmetsp:Transcript_133047/g.384847  ORF Transcript_133047/g.384847 Transcript_133047/m.384847 type:complete len:280 (+) Transcript_133047:1649-2488(+)
MSADQKTNEVQVMPIRNGEVGGSKAPTNGMTMMSYASKLMLNKSQTMRLALLGCNTNLLHQDVNNWLSRPVRVLARFCTPPPRLEKLTLLSGPFVGSTRHQSRKLKRDWEIDCCANAAGSIDPTAVAPGDVKAVPGSSELPSDRDGMVNGSPEGSPGRRSSSAIIAVIDALRRGGPALGGGPARARHSDCSEALSSLDSSDTCRCNHEVVRSSTSDNFGLVEALYDLWPLLCERGFRTSSSSRTCAHSSSRKACLNVLLGALHVLPFRLPMRDVINFSL